MARFVDRHQILVFCGAILAPSFLVGASMLRLWLKTNLSGRPGDSGRALRLLIP